MSKLCVTAFFLFHLPVSLIDCWGIRLSNLCSKTFFALAMLSYLSFSSFLLFISKPSTHDTHDTQILTQEDWNIVLFNAMERTNHWSAIYFVILMTFGNYVLFNLLVAILVEGFSSQDDHHSDHTDSEISQDEVRDEKLIYFYDPKDNLEHGEFVCGCVCMPEKKSSSLSLFFSFLCSQN